MNPARTHADWQTDVGEKTRHSVSRTVHRSLDSTLNPRLRVQRIGQDAPELVRFQDEPAQLPSAIVGKNGYLHLGFERRDDRTILAQLERRIPLLAQKALYWDESMPDMACVFIIMTSGCVLGGNRLALQIDASDGSRAHIMTQAATKIHTMDANFAAQVQHIHVGADAYLEFMPEAVIPHRGCRFLTETNITIDPSATLLYSEILMPGRKHLAMTSYSASTSSPRK
jgi:urease accessory protein